MTGTNVLTFGVPGSALAGSTFARFRFSTGGGLSFNGPAADGEVEDYAVTIVPVADLAVIATASPNPVGVGSNLTFTIVLSNAGPSTASGVTLTNQLPAGVTFVSVGSSQGSCSQSGGGIGCSIGTMNAGAAAVVSLVVAPHGAGQVTNVSAATAVELDLNPANNSSSVVETVLAPPIIVSQPQNRIVTNGATATFSVSASGAAPLRFQWRRNGSDLAGETNATLALPNAQPTVAGSYIVRVSNAVGAVESVSATLTVLVPPAIATPLQNVTNLAGGVASFNVAVTGTTPVTYQWFFNRSNLLAGATNAMLVLTNLQPTQVGVYGIIAQNSAGLATGDVVNLTVLSLDFGNAPDPGYPTLLTSDGARHHIVAGNRLGASVGFEPDGAPGATPADNDGVAFLEPILAGQNVSLTVIASTPGRLDAWLDFNRNNSWADAGERIFNNTALTAGTNWLSLAVPTGISFGTSAARFRFSTAGGLNFNGEAQDGEVEDYVVQLRPAVDLGVMLSATPQPVRVGSNLIFSITVTNAGPSAASAVMLTNRLPAGVSFVSVSASQGTCANDGGTVQCALGNLPASGSATLAVTATAVTDGLLTNQVSVLSAETDVLLLNNTAASVSSAFFQPVILTHPQSVIVTNGTPVTFSVMATGTALRYQWRRGALEIAGATNASFLIASAQTNDAGAYSVRITNEVGSVVSLAASLTVRVPASIIVPPQNQMVVEGGSATFSVVARGTEPLHFQWQFQNVDLPDSTNATLVINNAQPADAGEYRVVVVNDFAVEISGPATLTVVIAPSIVGHPQSRTNFAGSSTLFTAVVSGTPPLAYQWRFNGTNLLSGQTNATLLLTNLQLAHAGYYSITASNLGGLVASAAAELTVIEVDFGDAPEAMGYSTSLQFNGARHRLVPGVRLGALADFEPDGASSVSANGDDLTGFADEDGVVFTTPPRIRQIAVLQVTASTNGFLDGWVDFNANGSWLEHEDQIFASRALLPGVNVLTFTVPSGAVVTNTIARFRFSTMGGLSDDGWAEDGEVEDYAVAVQPAVDLVLNLKDDPDPVPAPGDVTYTMAVSNRGPSVATGVMLTNVLPPNAMFVAVESSQGACALVAGQVECALGSLAVGSTAVVTVLVHLEAPGRYNTVASAGAVEADIVPGNNTAAQTSSAIVLPATFESQLLLSVGDADLTGPGRGGEYPSTIEVAGLTGTVYQVTVMLRNLTHSFPDDFDVLLVGPDGRSVILLSDAGGAVPAPNAMITLDDTAQFSLPNAGFLFNQRYRPANFSGDDPDFFPAPAPVGPHGAALAVFSGADPNGIWSLYVVDDSVGDVGAIAGGWSLQISTIEPLADVAVLIQESSHPVAVGSNLTYTVTVTNRGPSDATAVLFTNVLPAGAALVSATMPAGPCTNEGGIIRCNLGNLPAGGAAVGTFVVNAATLGFLTNTASAAGGRLDLVASNNTAIAVTPVRNVVDVALTLAASSASVLVEQPLNYLLTVTNRGPIVATNVRLINVLPAGFVVSSSTVSPGSCSVQGGTLRCDFGNLAPGAGAVVQLAGVPSLAGPATNIASLLVDEVDFNGTDNVRTVITATVPYAGLTLSVAPAAPSTMLEGTNTYTLRVTNSGPSSPTVALSNALPKESRLLSVVPSQGSCSVTGGVVFCDFGALPRNTSAAVDFTVLWVAAGTFTNQAGISSDVLDLAPGDNALEFTTAVAAPAAKVLTVTSEPPLGSIDAAVSYFISVYYTGPGYPTGVVLRNLLPVGLEFVSASPSQGSCTNKAGLVVCDLGTLDGATPVEIFIAGMARQAGVLTNVTQMSGVPGANVVTQFTTVLAASARFANESEINIQDLAPPPPSTILVSGLTATVQRVTVTLSNLTHSFPDDLDIVLMGPGGRRIVLMSEAGGGTPVEGLTLSFDDNSPVSLPNNAPLRAGTYRPSNFATNADVMPAALPGSMLSEFQDTNPNGLWSLHIVDGEGRDSGVLSGGWSLAIATLHPIADLGVTATALPEPVAVGSNLTITVTVTNLGPANATSVVLKSMLPPQVNIVSLTGGPGGCTNDEGVIRCALGTLPPGGSTMVTLILSPQTPNPLTNQVSVNTGAVDFHHTNDAVEVVSSVEVTPFIIAPPLPRQVVEGANVTLRVSAGGTEPLRYQWRFHGTNLPGATNDVLAFTSATRADTGPYVARVENAVGGVFSDGALLQVLVPPTISGPGDRILQEDAASALLPFVVGDYETSAGALTVQSFSSDPALIPLSGIVLGGAGSNRTVQILPATNAFGSALITLLVRDESDLTASTSFTVTVLSVNDAPVLGAIADAQTPEDTATTVSFPVGDVETAAGALTLGALSSDTNLLPLANIQFGGAGASRSITVLPGTNQFGSVTVTVTVTDADSGSSSRSFALAVAPVNDVPTLGVISNVTVVEDSGPQVVNLTGISSGAANEPQTLTITATSSDTAVVPHPVVTYTSPEAVGSLQFTPVTNASGVATVTVTVDDGGVTNRALVRTFTVTVTPVNDPPVISALTNLTLLEDAPSATQPFLIADVETSADSLQLSATSSNTNLVSAADIVLGGAGSSRTVSVTPALNQNGSSLITVTVRDAAGDTAASTFLVTVVPVNDPPVVSAIADRTINEDTVTGIIFTVSDVETAAGSLNLVRSSSNPAVVPDSGLTISGAGTNRTLTIAPVPDQSGVTLISIVLSDPEGLSVTNRFNLTVAAVNDAPTLATIADVTVNEDSGTVALPLSGISTGATNELQFLSFSAVSTNLTLLASTEITYLHPRSTGTLQLVTRPNAVGTTLVTVTVDDGAPSNRLVSRSFRITVLPVNDAPVISILADRAINEDTVANLSFTLMDQETPATSLTVTARSSNPALVPDANLVLGGAGTNRTLAITPLTNQSGTATITLTASDSNGGSNAVSFVLTVHAVNDAPVIAAIGGQVANEDMPTGAIPFTIGDVETPAAGLVVTAASSDLQLVPNANILLGGSGSNRTVAITPATNQSGSATITLTVRDAEGLAAMSLFVLTVNPQNDAPILSNLTDRSVGEDTPTTLSFTVGDVETPAASLDVTGASSNIQLVPNAGIALGGSGSNRFVTITPAPNQSGSATITLTVTDASGGSASSSFVLTVNPLNDPPVISTIADQNLDEDHSTSALAFTVDDVETTAGGLAIAASSSNPGLVPQGAITLGGSGSNRTVTVSPLTNQSGFATITMTVSDGAGGSNATSFVVSVNAVNDAPVISPIAGQATNEDTPAGAIPFTVGDVETPASDLVVTASSSNPALVPGGGISLGGSSTSRTIMITPAMNQSGSATITVTVRDAEGLAASSSFALTVNAVNDAPLLSPLGNLSTAGAVPVSQAFSVSDVETSAGALGVTASSSNPALIPVSNIVISGSGGSRVVTITALNNQTGSATLTLTVTDGNGGAASNSFTVTVTPALASPPTISSQPQSQTVSNGANVTFNVTAAGTAPLAYQWKFNGSNLPGSTNASLTLPNVLGANAGNYQVVVTNQAGSLSSAIAVLTVLSGPLPPVVTIVPTGAVWKFLDTGANLGTNWVGTNFNDAAWLSGPAQLGYGDGDEATLVGFGPDPNNRFITTYFRRTFVVADPSVFTSLAVRLKRDDGGIVYLNGAEVFRENMPVGAISNLTLAATTAADDGTNFLTNAVSAALLLAGTNTLAVEIHQSAANSSDISFDLELTGVMRDLSRPAISDVANQTTSEDTPITIPFTVTDPDTAVFRLALSAASGNTALVPAGNISFDGSGTNRTVTIVPAPNQSGTALITLTVSDGTTNAADTFVLTVNAVNDPPTLNPITNVALIVNFSNSDILFNGIGTGAANESQTLTVTAVSSNIALVTINSVSYTAGATNGSVRLASPSNTGTGTAVVAVTVSDGVNTTTRAFTVFVWPTGNVMPTVSAITNQVTAEDTPTAAIPFTVGDSVTPAALLTLSGLSSNTNLVPNANIVFGGAGSNRTVTVTPALNQIGSASITVFVNDTNFGMANRTFVLTVNPVNDLPLVTPPANQTINEDGTTGLLSFAVSDAETPAANLAVTASSSSPGLVPNANIVLGGSGTNRALTITPLPNQSGAATITLTAIDGTGGTNSATFVVNVTSVNDLPAISSISDQVLNQAGPSAPLPFTIGDLETPAASLTLTGASSNTNLVPNANIVFGGSASNRTVTITPEASQAGSTVITVTVNDGNGGTAATAFSVTVNSVNQAPTLNAISNLVLNQNAGPQTVGLRGITSGGTNEIQRLAVSASSSNPGLLPDPDVTYSSPDASGSLILLPTQGSNGLAIVTVTVNDGQAANNLTTRTFSVTVRAAPNISTIADQTINEDAATGPIAFAISDADTATSDLVLVASSSNPALAPTNNIVLSGSGTNRTVTIAPPADQFGLSMITLIVTDSDGNSTSNSFALIVKPVNDRPTLDAIDSLLLSEDAGSQTIVLGGIGSGAGNESQALIVNAVSSNPALVPHPTVSYATPGVTGTLSLVPLTNASGSATISVTVNDGGSLNAIVTRTLTVTITPLNDLPILGGIPDVTTPEDTSTGPIGFIVDDVETAAGSLTLAGSSSNPTLIPNANISFGGAGSTRSVTIIPATNQIGTATITIDLSDGDGGISSRTFVITVLPINDPPMLSVIADQTVNEDAGTSVTVTIGDLETPASGLVVSASSSNPSLVPNGNLVMSGSGSVRTLSITPAANQFGAAVITVSVVDAEGAAVSNSFNLTVLAVNDSPTLAPIPNLVIRENAAAQIVSLSGISSGASNEFQNLLVTAVSSNPSLIPAPQVSYATPAALGSLGFVVAPNSSGSSLLSVTVSDDEGGSVTQSFTVTVFATNQPPVITDIPDQVTLVSTPVFIGFNVVDAETPAGALLVSVQSSNPSIVPPAGIALGGSDGNRALLISPVANTTGTVAIIVTVMDGRGATASDTFLLQIRPPGQPPAIASQPSSQTIPAGSPATFAVVAVGTAPLTYQWELNGLALVNRTNTTLTLAAIQPGDAGGYRVLVSNPLGSVLSEAAVLRVLVSPTITAITNNGSRAEISFSTLSGLNYVVEYRNAVNAGAWSVLTSASGTGGIITVIDPELTRSSRFYRVRVE